MSIASYYRSNDYCTGVIYDNNDLDEFIGITDNESPG